MVVPPIDDKGVVTLNVEDSDGSVVLAQEGPTRSRRNGKVPPSSGKSDFSASRTSKKKSVPGLNAFDEIIRNAEYEVNVDPYRGIFSSESTDHPRSPWLSCAVDSTKMEEESGSQPLDIVREATKCQCPSLVSWTSSNLQVAKSRRKRLRSTPLIGQRSDNCNTLCRCDSNPFCLASLGGAVNKIIAVSSAKEIPDVGVIEIEDEDPMKKYDPDEDDCIYSELTKAQLQGVRRQTDVATKKVSAYLKRSLQELITAYPVQQAINTIRERHYAQIFPNPLIPNDSSTNNEIIQISMPPGIENLGATCYLNTQLQCLAQNLIFLEGILSWTPPDDGQDNNNEKVLTAFQTLLANMIVGPRCVLNASDFTKSLGLDHYEQQDPNEFSRLFMDFLHQTFSTCNKPDLVSLLPTLFQGKTTYTTKCSVCKNGSRREEHFMDITLPILRRKKEAGQQTLTASMKKIDHDTDLQFCMDSYIRVEKLEGDNQYYCDVCGRKEDAERALSFSKLPPVLNIQLCRYVYDRSRGIKTKVQDKVLLPSIISLREARDATKEKTEEKRYALCAVMIHKGKSAYSGHYIAEAVNWETGQWFEFNDTKVRPLEHASCSYEALPGKPIKGTGSSDAYNMYYVEETFLAQSILSSLRGKRSPEVPKNVRMVVTDLKTYFEALTEQCWEDGRAARRLEDRRDFIHKSLFPNLSVCQHHLHSNSDLVWVNQNFLRRYLSCSDRLEREFCDLESVLQVKDYFCSHRKGLHPRVARRGKLIPKFLYKILLCGLEDERSSFESLASESDTVADAELFAVDIFCKECRDSYKSELAEKLDLCKKLRYLYDSLDLAVEPMGKVGDAAPEPAFVVSRKFITCFRARITKLMKLGVDFGSDVKHKHIAEDSTTANIVEGLDSIDVRGLIFPDATSSAVTDQLDASVNGNITCDHGVLNCSNSLKKRSKIISSEVWTHLKEFFPDAIEVKLDGGIVESTPMCTACDTEQKSSQNLRLQFRAIAKRFKQRHTEFYMETQTVIDREVGGTGARGAYRLVHFDDLTTWKKFTNFFSRNENKMTWVEIKDKVHQIFPSIRPESSTSISRPGSPCSEQKVSWCLTRLRPIVCSLHFLPLQNAVLRLEATKDTSLSKSIVLVEEATYRAYVAGLYEVARLVAAVEEGRPEQEDVIPAEAMAGRLERLESSLTLQNWHARVTRADNEQSEDIIYLNGKDSRLSLFANNKFCTDDACSAYFNQWRNDHQSDKPDSASDTAADGTGGEGDPICLDVCESQPGSGGINLRIFHTSVSPTKEAIIKPLLDCLQLPQLSGIEKFVRRSTRARKTAYPNGPILGEDDLCVSQNDNIASIRLRLLESATAFEPDHKLFLATLPCPPEVDTEREKLPSDNETELPPGIHPIEFSANGHSLNQVCTDLLGSDFLHATGSNTLCMLRQGESVKRSDMTDNSLLDHLINISSGSKAAGKEASGKRKRSEERGFTGTLLSSGPATTSSADLKQDDDNESVPLRPEKQSKVDGTSAATANAANVDMERRADDEIECLGVNEANNASYRVSEEPPRRSPVLTRGKFASNASHANGSLPSEQHIAGGPTGSDEGEQMFQRVFFSLSKNPAVSDRRICLEAAQWVVEHNPASTDVTELSDNAYAKYIDLMS